MDLLLGVVGLCLAGAGIRKGVLSESGRLYSYHVPYGSCTFHTHGIKAASVAHVHHVHSGLWQTCMWHLTFTGWSLQVRCWTGNTTYSSDSCFYGIQLHVCLNNYVHVYYVYLIFICVDVYVYKCVYGVV